MKPSLSIFDQIGNVTNLSAYIFKPSFQVPGSNMKAKPLPSFYKRFVGKNCMEKFIEELRELAYRVLEWNETNRPAIYTTKIDRAFLEASKYYCCGIEFYGEEVPKIYEHNHLSREYRGAVCHHCTNSLRVYNNVLLNIFHSFKNYDAQYASTAAEEFKKIVVCN